MLVVLTACVLTPTTGVLAEDWPQWRGPSRTGVTSESSGFPAGWPPKRLWTANLGVGATSPVIADGRVFVMGWQGPGKGVGNDAVFCLDASTGKELWRQTYRSRYQGRLAVGDKRQYGGPNSTPAYDKETGYLFTLGIDGDFRCWDARRGGRLVWAKNFYDEFHVPQRPVVGSGSTGKRDYGFCSSPLLYHDQVIVDVGGPAGLVMGFDKKTGKVRWRSQSKEMAASNSGPVLMQVDRADCVVSLGLRGLIITRIDTGRTVARVPWETSFAANIPTPGVLGKKIVLTSAYNVSRTGMFVVSGKRIRKLWTVRERVTVSSPVLHGGNVLLPEGSLRCLDITSGRLKWRVGSLGSGSCIVIGDGKVIAHGRGSLILVDEAAGKEISSIKGVPSGWPSIAFGSGIILCKDNAGKLLALSVRTPVNR